MNDQWQIVKEQQARIAALEAERAAAMLQVRDSHNALTAFGVPCESHEPHDGCETQLGHRVRLVLKKLTVLLDIGTDAEAERDRYAADLHTRNGELLVARMNLDMLRDDVKRAIALLPQDPGAALGVLVSAPHSQNAPQGPQNGPRETIGA